MAETLIIILAEHNVPINFAHHFTKLVSNKLVFSDCVFLRMRAAHAPCSLKVVIACVVTNFFSRNLTGLLANIFYTSGARFKLILKKTFAGVLKKLNQNMMEHFCLQTKQT